MIKDVRRMLEAQPFKPFSIVMSGGKEYPVPTRDHAGVSPVGSQLVIWFDDGSGVTVSSLHITALETRPNGTTDRGS